MDIIGLKESINSALKLVKIHPKIEEELIVIKIGINDGINYPIN